MKLCFTAPLWMALLLLHVARVAVASATNGGGSTRGMNKSHKKEHKSNYEHYKVSSSSRSNNREPIIKVGFSYNATDVIPAAFQPNRTINTAGTLGYGTFHLAFCQ